MTSGKFRQDRHLEVRSAAAAATEALVKGAALAFCVRGEVFAFLVHLCRGTWGSHLTVHPWWPMVIANFSQCLIASLHRSQRMRERDGQNN